MRRFIMAVAIVLISASMCFGASGYLQVENCSDRPFTVVRYSVDEAKGGYDDFSYVEGLRGLGNGAYIEKLEVGHYGISIKRHPRVVQMPTGEIVTINVKPEYYGFEITENNVKELSIGCE
jgi:hypothetical protein